MHTLSTIDAARRCENQHLAGTGGVHPDDCGGAGTGSRPGGPVRSGAVA